MSKYVNEKREDWKRKLEVWWKRTGCLGKKTFENITVRKKVQLDFGSSFGTTNACLEKNSDDQDWFSCHVA